MRKLMVLAVVLCATVGVQASADDAFDASWKTNTATGTGFWVQPQYWTDANGADLTAAPTTRLDSAYIDAVLGQRRRKYTLNLARRTTSVTYENGGSRESVELGTVASSFRLFLRMRTDAAGAAYEWPAMTTSVANPNGFLGFWDVENGFGKYVFEATPELPHSVFAVNTDGYNGIEVPAAGSEVSVGSLYGQGSLRKEGPGNLTVRDGSGIHSQIYVAEGSLTLNGAANEAVAAGLPRGAWLHLDASKAETLETFEQDGRTCVAKWSDCDGGPIYALTSDYAGTATHLIKNSHAPFISEETSGTGLTLVDFGMHFSEAAAAGMPSNCWLKLNAGTENVREVFYVAKLASALDQGFTLLGNTKDSPGYYDLAGGGPFNVWGASVAKSVQEGETYMNGAPTMWRDVSSTVWGTDLTSLSVVSGSSETDLRVSCLGSDRHYSNYTGAWRVGEILVYTNQLTHDERMIVHRHLMRKWLPNAREDEAGEVVLDTDDAMVVVPAGRTVRIKSLSTMGTKIVKDGGGKLVVDGVSPSGVPIEVRGGSVEVRTPTVTADAPADNAYLWLDATIEDSLVHSNDENGVATKYVTRWNDRRSDRRGENDVYAEVPPIDVPYDQGGSVYATDPQFTGHLPWLTDAISPTGLKAVDFGSTEDDLTFMWQQPHGVTKIYTGFAVLRGNSEAYEFFGGSWTHFLRAFSKETILQARFSRAEARVSYTFDGRPVDPFQPTSMYKDMEGFHVISFAAKTKLECDLIAKYTQDQKGYGGKVKIGEYILYDRMLTPEERRNTEAYLMKKWLDKDHPESSAGFRSTTTYALSASGVVDLSTDEVVENPVGPSSLVKRGSGSATINDIAHATNFTAIAAEEGAVTVRLELPDDACYRYDASDVDSFTSTYASDDGKGGLQTNILRWADQKVGYEAISAHENGFSTSYAGASGSTTTNPVLTVAQMPDGVMRPTVDFLNYLNVATLYKNPATGKNDPVDPAIGHPYGAWTTPSSGFKLKDFSATTKFQFNEMHTVFSDSANSKSEYVFGCWQWEQCKRGSNGKLLSDAKTGDKFTAAAGYIGGQAYVNGESVVATNYVLPAGFNAISFRTSEPVTVNAIAIERNCNSGGCKISEYAVYTNRHSEEVCTYLDRRLMRKWFGAERPMWLTAFDSLAAEKDATVTLAADDKIAVTELAGEGTIVAPELVNVSEVRITGLDSPLTVDGSVAFDGTVTVTLDFEVGRIRPGTYTLMTADSFAVAPQTLNLIAMLPKSRQATVRVEGNAIVMDVTKDGAVLIVR